MSIVSKHSYEAASCRTIVVDGVVRIHDVDAPDLASATMLLRQVDAAYPEQPKIGPIGPDTWGDYRVVKRSDGSPSFPGEPDSPDWMAKAWWAAGFNVIESYSSAIDTAPKVRGRWSEPYGTEIRRWSEIGAEALLRALHAMSEKAFAGAPYFSPISADDFVQRFGRILAGPAAEFSYVAMKEGGPVGFMLGYPDGRGGHVAKTLVSTVPGLGGALSERFLRDAIKAGTTHIIHALMHDDNVSQTMSAKFGVKVFRRYALFGKGM